MHSISNVASSKNCKKSRSLNDFTQFSPSRVIICVEHKRGKKVIVYLFSNLIAAYASLSSLVFSSANFSIFSGKPLLAIES